MAEAVRLQLHPDEIILGGWPPETTDVLVDFPDATFRSSSANSHTRRGVWNLDDGGRTVSVRWRYDDRFEVLVLPFCTYCEDDDSDEPLIEAPLPLTVAWRWHHRSCAYLALGDPNPVPRWLRRRRHDTGAAA